MSMRRALRACVVAVAVSSLLAACTSQTDDEEPEASETTERGTASGAGNTVGLTDDSIKISLIAADLALLAEQNLAPEIGNAAKTLEAVVADINANGGIAGREVELVPHVVSGAEAQLNPDLARQVCVQATEDDQPFAIIIAAAIPAEAIECTAIDHDILTITMDSWPDRYYERSEGRVFSLGSHISLGRDRVYRGWPKILDEQGLLEGKRIGIIRQDTPDHEASVEEALKPALEDLGYEVAAEAALPCPEGSATCEQHEVAIQRMQDGDVDLVFLVAQNLAGSGVVEAAQNLGFEPQWVTVGNNATNTVAKFYANAKDNYDGAIAIDTGFQQWTEEAAECNRIAVEGGAEEFPEGSDGYGFTAVTCLQLQSLAAAIESIDGDVDQAAVIAALENLDPVPMLTNPPGALSADKHDAGTSVFLSQYSADTQQFEPIDDRNPIEVDG
jgi:ABC-type branched-subunit amino acid transport system substrate-binding protein